jgi:hypothetical protein
MRVLLGEPELSADSESDSEEAIHGHHGMTCKARTYLPRDMARHITQVQIHVLTPPW